MAGGIKHGNNLRDDQKRYFGNSRDFSFRFDSVEDKMIIRDEINDIDILEMSKGAVAEFLPEDHDIITKHTTTEMVTDKVLKPNGTGGVKWTDFGALPYFEQDDTPDIDDNTIAIWRRPTAERTYILVNRNGEAYESVEVT